MVLEALLLFCAALLAGGLNSVAGGGSFLTFPALIVSGVAPISANATNTVALWPGSVASVGAYRRELADVPQIPLLGAVSLVGGGLGALLLLNTPAATFQRLVPFLLLLATVLFAFSKPITTRLAAFVRPAEGGSSRQALGTVIALQLVVATYGGYFGGGIGILMLALFGLLGLENIHHMNALKTLLASCINGVAVLTFIAARAVAWPPALLMLVGAVVGGYAGAAVARRLDPLLVRRFVILVGCTMTLYFFINKW